MKCSWKTVCLWTGLHTFPDDVRVIDFSYLSILAAVLLNTNSFHSYMGVSGRLPFSILGGIIKFIDPEMD